MEAGLSALPTSTAASRGGDRSPAWWPQVEALAARAPRPSDLLWHRLHLVATPPLRARGEPVPEEFLQEEIGAAVMLLAAPVVLARVRSSLDGPIALMKGPELAALYPDPAMRPFRDVDLLVPDPGEAWRSLRRAGFRPTGDPRLYEDIHHLRPLYLPGYPLVVEVHAHPKWVEWGTPPSTEELLSRAVASVTGIDGLLALAPADHAVAVAVHSWAHEPLRRLHELVDVRLLTDAAGSAEAAAAARRLEVDRVWHATTAAAAALLDGRRRPFALHGWARNLVEARERTVLESHLEHWLAPFSAQSPVPATRASLTAMWRDLRPGPDERWRGKLARSARALGNAFARRSDHDRRLARREDEAKP